MTILTALLEATLGTWLIAGVIGLVRVGFRRVLSSKAKYYLWALLALRLMLPVLPESPLSLMNLLPQRETEVVSETAADTIVPNDPVWLETAPETTPVPVPTIAAPLPEQTIPAETAPVQVVEETAAPVTWEQVVLWVWLGGAGLVLLAYLLLYAITARQLRRLPCVTDPDTLRIFLKLKRDLGIRGKVNLVSGGGGMLGGLLRPTVVIPTELHGQEVTPILVHELLHYKYKDLWISLLFRVLTAFHWFNPVVWLCFHILRNDSEAACDQRVLESGLVERQRYATVLYEEGVLQMKNHVLMQTTFGGDGRSLKRRIRLIAQFRRPKVWMTVLTVVLALVISACTLTGAQRDNASSAEATPPDFDTYMTDKEPPNGIFGLTFEEHVERGLLDPDQGTLEHYTDQDTGLTFSGFTTTMELGGQTVEIAYSFGQNVLTDQETLKQVFVIPPEDVPIGTWLERISDPWLSGMTQNTDVNYWEWDTKEYVADLLTEEQLQTVIDAEVSMGETSNSPEFPKTVEDAEHLLKTNWHIVTAFYSGEGNVWQFNGTGAALVRAAQAMSGNPDKADQFPEGMDMDSYIEAIQPGFGHYGWSFQEHLDAGLLDEGTGEWAYQSDHDSGFMTEIVLDGMTLEAEFIFSQTLFTWDTDAPQVLTEVLVTVPSDVLDGIQWGLDLMDPWAEYMTLGGNGANFRGTPVNVGTHLTNGQRETAAQMMVEIGHADSLENARDLLDNWSIAGGEYRGNQGVWQFNGTGAALYLTRPVNAEENTPSLETTISPYILSDGGISYGSTQWGMTPDQVLDVEGLDAEQWSLLNRGRNYYMSGTIPSHPEIVEAEFEFHFTDLDLTLGLDYVEVEYDQDMIGYEDLLALRKEQLGAPTFTQGTTIQWDRADGGFTLTLTANGFLRETLHYWGPLYDAEELANFDPEEYLSTIQAPNGHYGWTYDQHVAAGLLDPDSGTFEPASGDSEASVFHTQIQLGGETVSADYVFSTTLATRNTSGKAVLTQVMVTPPEGVAISQWVASFSDSFTDKLYESDNLIYKSPVSVGGLLPEAQQAEIMDAARALNDGSNMTLGGWSLVQNWYQQEARIWHFNGTGAALYLTATEAE